MKPANIRSWLCGPMVAVATPFTENFDLDLDAFQTNIRFMIDNGVRTGQGSLLVAGAGGEHPTLNVEERKAIMDTAVETARGEVPLLASIQHTDMRITVDLAQHASKVGLNAVQLSPPYYYDTSQADAVRVFEMVAKTSEISIMIYHTWWDGLNMNLDLLKRLAEIETVRALKWSTPEETQFREGLQALASDLVIIDNSQFLRPVYSHMLGAGGFITHLSNFWPEYPLEIWNLLGDKDYDEVKHKLASFKWKWMNWRHKVGQYTGGEGPFIKAGMEAVGLQAGPPRPPSVRPPKHLLHELQELFASSKVPRVRDRVEILRR